MVQSLLEKLPEQLRLTITRGEDHHEWNLEPLSDILGHEVELREEYHRNPRNTRNPQDEFKRKTSMHTGKQITVTFVCEDTTMRNARKSRMSMSVSNH